MFNKIHSNLSWKDETFEKIDYVTVAAKILKSDGQNRIEQQTQNDLFWLVQTSPQNSANWSYNTGTIVCPQTAKL